MDDPLSNLKSDLANMKGTVALLETTAAQVGGTGGEPPVRI